MNVTFTVKQNDFEEANKIISLILMHGVSDVYGRLKDAYDLNKGHTDPQVKPVHLLAFLGDNCFCGNCAKLFEGTNEDPWSFQPGRTALTNARRTPIHLSQLCEPLAQALHKSETPVRGVVLPETTHRKLLSHKKAVFAARKAEAEGAILEVTTAQKASEATLKTVAAKDVVNSGQAADTIIAPVKVSYARSLKTKDGVGTESEERIARASSHVRVKTQMVVPSVPIENHPAPSNGTQLAITQSDNSEPDNLAPAGGTIAIARGRYRWTLDEHDRIYRKWQLELSSDWYKIFGRNMSSACLRDLLEGVPLECFQGDYPNRVTTIFKSKRRSRELFKAWAELKRQGRAPQDDR